MPAPRTSLRGSSPPERIGRYVVLGVLGRGGMGVVLKSYDEQLDRLVAIKVLHEHLGHGHTARLRREARAMAKLSHPNVVQVYEIGEIDGQIFVAMELVKGKTVQEWMEQEPRPTWQAVVEVFVQLGAGLAAAHDSGLVHRDFKPGNAVVDEDGRARVLDFGLARRGDEQMDEASPERPRDEPPDAVLLEQPLTQTGAILGTPAYMPLEQVSGKEADARSDQFSFCVALYEAVYGERPYAGETLPNLVSSMQRGEVSPAPKGSGVPMALRKVLVRGLAVEPDQRWRSMEVLLVELRRLVAPRRRWALMVGVGVGLLAVGIGLSTTRALEWLNRCTGARDQLEGVWDEERRQEAKAAIVGTGISYAPDAWDRVEPRLDDYADAWVVEHTDACEATRSRGEQSEEDMSLRMSCLEQRRQHLRATVDELRHADATVVKNAVHAAASLPGLERCRDLEALQAEVPPPEDPAVAERVEALDARLVEVNVKRIAGKYGDGLRLVEEVLEEGARLDYEPLMVRAWLLQVSLMERNGDYAEIEPTLKNVYVAAVAHTMNFEALRASTKLVPLLSERLGRHDDARRWLEHAEPLSRAVGTDLARGKYLRARGVLAGSQGEFDEARDYFEQVLAITQKALGPEVLDVANALYTLGIVAQKQGEPEDARDFLQRALAIRERWLGPEHPFVARVLYVLGEVARSQGKYDEACDFHERALTIRETTLDSAHPDVARSLFEVGKLAKLQGRYEEARRDFGRLLILREQQLGPDHLQVAELHNMIGVTARRQGKYAEARLSYERALAIRTKALDPEHPRVVGLLNNLGNVAMLQGEYDEARTLHERALAIREKTLGPDHQDVARSLKNLGNLAMAQGRYEEACEWHERALATWDKALGPEHVDSAMSLIGLGQSRLGLDEPVEALAPLERALALRGGRAIDPAGVAEIRFALARALWSAPADRGGDRSRARDLAEQARDAYATLVDAKKTELEQVQAWLAEHRL